MLGGRVRELIPIYPSTLNPVLVEGESGQRVGSLLFNGLMEIDPQTRMPVPALASEVTVSPNGLRYTFRLRPGLRWHDGAPVTAEDVVWTYELLQQPELQAPLQPYTERIETVKASTPSTVQFTLSEPYSPFLARLGTVGLIPRKPFAGLSGPKLRATLLDWRIGTGPFRWASAMHGQSIELDANPAYFKGAPRLDGYRFTVSRNTTSVQEALTSGEVDVAWLPPSVADEIREQDFLTQATLDTPTTTLLFFNLNSPRAPALQDARVRRALAHALDTQRLGATMDGALQPTYRYQPPTSPAYEPVEEPPYPYDPSRAGSLLSQSGWTDGDGDGVRQKGGRRLRLTIYANQVPPEFPQTLGASYTPALKQVAANWKAVGVDARVQQEGWERLASRLFSDREFDVALLTVSTDADPDQSYLWATGSYLDAFNIGRYTDREVDRLLSEGVRRQTPEQRSSTYQELEQVLTEDLPATPLGATRMVLLQNNRLVGPDADYWSALQHTNVEKWYVQDGR